MTRGWRWAGGRQRRDERAAVRTEGAPQQPGGEALPTPPPRLARPSKDSFLPAPNCLRPSPTPPRTKKAAEPGTYAIERSQGGSFLRFFENILPCTCLSAWSPHNSRPLSSQQTFAYLSCFEKSCVHRCGRSC